MLTRLKAAPGATGKRPYLLTDPSGVLLKESPAVPGFFYAWCRGFMGYIGFSV